MTYLRVGPPLYLVVERTNVSARSDDVNKLCSVAGCRTDSLSVRVGRGGMAAAGGRRAQQQGRQHLLCLHAAARTNAGLCAPHLHNGNAYAHMHTPPPPRAVSISHKCAQVSNAALSPGSTYIASPAASWLDDFLSWINPSLPKCCRASSQDEPALGELAPRQPRQPTGACQSGRACAHAVCCARVVHAAQQ